MLRAPNILTIAVLSATLVAAANSQAQTVRFNPDPEGTGPGLEQPSECFLDHQLGVRFTRVDLEIGESRPSSVPSVRFNPDPGGEVVIVKKGLRVDWVDCHGMGKRIGLERGDVIVRCETTAGFDPGYGSGHSSTRLQLVDIRTGRTVNIELTGIHLNLNIDGKISRPGTGPYPEVDPLLPENPDSRPSFHRHGG